MEILRETLKLLFLHRDIYQVVDAAIDDQQVVTKKVDRGFFTHRFSAQMCSCTLDQTELVWGLLNKKWMQPDTSLTHLQFASNKCIYNSLLYFAKECLKEKNETPVCQYDNLLRWHDLTSQLTEDLLVTAFLASCDLKIGFIRRNFAWSPVLDHDNVVFNRLFEKPLADLHFHLMGSSLVFELSWLSIMNHPKRAYGKLKGDKWGRSKLTQEEGEKWQMRIKTMLVWAAAIRNFLFRTIEGLIDEDDNAFMKEVIQKKDIDFSTLISQLDELIKGNKDFAYKYKKETETTQVVVDYAITEDSICCGNDENMYLNTVIGGERRLMYHLFRKIFNNDSNEIESLFYIYLLIKGQFRHELVQLNDTIGFANFNEFDERKHYFVDKYPYNELVKQMAVRSFVETKDRHLEVRITPKKTYEDLNRNIVDTDKAINNAFCSSEICSNYYYILHFIKKDDDEYEGVQEAHPRHDTLRNEVKDQSKALVEWKYKEGNMNANRVIGVDAANSECHCRPEVFGQAYRYLRYNKPNNGVSGVCDFRFTYHVGEDYFDVVDGLRALDEALIFLEMEKGDRVGHALVLGEEVEKYYNIRHNMVVMTKQTILDNVAWLMNRGRGLPSYEIAYSYMRTLYENYFRYVFKSFKMLPTELCYMQSWLLRGDNPLCYQNLVNHVEPRTRDLTFWTAYDFQHNNEVEMARKNSEACLLYSAYHFDEDVKKRGAEPDEIKIDAPIVKLIDELQGKMLDGFERRGIGIECNPTSNLKTGQFKKYRNHPIFRFNNVGLEGMGTQRSILVSINTDDKGIFATSLEREYSLLSAALEKDYLKGVSSNSPTAVFKWLDNVRDLSFLQRFA